MKEEKLFEIVNNVDDDLICEMLEYRSDRELQGEEYQGALYHATENPRRMHYWRYPVTVAALMLVLVGVLFIVNSNNTLPYNEGDEENTSDISQEITTTSTEENTVSNPVSGYSPYAVPADSKINYQFTAEDKELHVILEELDNGWSIFAHIANDPDNFTEDGKGLWVNFTQVDEPFDMFYFELSEELPFGNIEEMKAEINRCFTKEAAEKYFRTFGLITGEIASEADGVSTIYITDYEYLYENVGGELIARYPLILELDGKLYRMGDGFGTRLLGIDYSTTRVLSRTEEELVFAFIYPVPHEEFIVTAKETLKFEDGGWKYDRVLSYPEEENYLDFYEVWGGDSVKSSPLDLLHCRLGEDGRYRVDEDALTVTDDYDLFREYFFGTWEDEQGWGSISNKPLVVDDSMKCFNITDQLNNWYSGKFYKIGDSTLAFVAGGSGGSILHWLDMNEPETLYYAYGGVGENNWLWPPEDAGAPIVSSLKKSDIPPNEPEENFLSIFKLREISRDYGIDFDLLVDIEYDYEQPDMSYTLSHNAYALFYPVYLVSESADKLELKTTIGNGFDEGVEFKVSYTIEKIDGEWTRTVDTSNIYRGIVVIGEYDSSALVDFEYGELLERTTRHSAGAGDFIDEEYAEFVELYQKAYAFYLAFYGRYPFSYSGNSQGARILVPYEDWSLGYKPYELSGFSYDSFYKAVREVFTEELTDRLISEDYSAYEYDGALWTYFYDGLGGDPSRIHDEYDCKLTGDIFDIILTVYHTTAELGWDYNPELKDKYETEERRFIFVKTEEGWRCSRFDEVW